MVSKKLQYCTLILFGIGLVAFLFVFTIGKKKSEHKKYYASNTKDSLFHFASIPKVSPALFVKRNEKDTTSVPLKLNTLKIDVEVIGNLVETTMEMVFYNDLNRDLEGQFYFPLAEGQTITRFAMDMNSILREGVVVEKAKGRATYESVIRRKIDPGLLEWSKGNNFKARIFPIPAGGYKKIVVSYSHELYAASNNYIYWQPFYFSDTIKNFEIMATVYKIETRPTEKDSNLVNFHFKEFENAWIAHEKVSDIMVNKPISFKIPAEELVNKVFVEEIPNTDSIYFYTCLQPEKFVSQKQKIDKLGIVWDISESGSKRDLEKEIDILDNYFHSVKDIEVELIPFANQIFKIENYTVKNADWEKLKLRLQNLVNDGGTQLGCIDFRKYEANEFFMFSDGISNFGKETPLFSKVPVTTIVTSISADYSFLKYISQKTNGNFINASILSANQVVNKLQENAYRFIGVSTVSGNSFDIFPSIATDFNRNFAIAGKMKGSASEIRLNFGLGSKSMKEYTIKISKRNRVSTGSINKLWAGKKIAELDLFPEINLDEITALGLKYGIITRNTSLLVLDQLDDYIQHHIMPPPGKMRIDYLANILKEDKDEKKVKEEHLKAVIQMFNERKTWWNTKFEYPKYEKPSRQEPREIVRRTDSVVIDDEVNIEEVTDSSAVSSEERWSFSSGYGNGSGNQLTERMYFSSSTSHDLIDAGSYTTHTWTTNANMNVSINTQSENNQENADIDIKTWVPDASYIKPLQNAPKDKAYSIYLKLKSKNKDTPAYYFDAADILLQKGLKSEAIRVLSNIAELELENHELLRTLAHRLQQLKKYDLAICIFKDVLKIREEEPQSYRDLGLIYAENRQYQEAVDNLCKVINNKWDGRFPEIELICIGEVNRIIALSTKPLDLKNFDNQFQKNLPVDIRVVIGWDSDNCDMDLWVTDPTGEKTYYSSPKSQIGGRISRDFTGGYGPEEFVIKNAMTGNYLVEVDYFGSSRQTISGPTTVQAKLIAHFGSKKEKTKEITIRLKQAKEVIQVGNLYF